MEKEAINERFRLLRLESGKSQEEWGKILGLTKSGVSNIENGIRSVSERHLIMLSNWKERFVNIEWLRTGEGEMFLKLRTNNLVASAAQLLGKKDPLLETFLETYSTLSPESREIIMNYLLDFAKTLSGKVNPE